MPRLLGECEFPSQGSVAGCWLAVVCFFTFRRNKEEKEEDPFHSNDPIRACPMPVTIRDRVIPEPGWLSFFLSAMWEWTDRQRLPPNQHSHCSICDPDFPVTIISLRKGRMAQTGRQAGQDSSLSHTFFVVFPPPNSSLSLFSSSSSSFFFLPLLHGHVKSPPLALAPLLIPLPLYTPSGHHQRETYDSYPNINICSVLLCSVLISVIFNEPASLSPGSPRPHHDEKSKALRHPGLLRKGPTSQHDHRRDKGPQGKSTGRSTFPHFRATRCALLSSHNGRVHGASPIYRKHSTRGREGWHLQNHPSRRLEAHLCTGHRGIHNKPIISPPPPSP